MSQTAPSNPDREAGTIAGPELPDSLLQKLRISIPGYELLDQIAVGGQATVYRARELISGLTVAIKVLHGGANAGPDSRERLGRETAALNALNHPNIVCVIESGRTPMGLDYLVMNYVDGQPLDALWKDAEFSAAVAPEPPARLRLFKHICDIVQAAHLKGITHRDLSPSNILITAEGEPYVLDVGLASTAFNDLLTPEGRRVSLTGQFLGKVQYAAPEQARGGRNVVDIRTDVYALGVILYQILTNGVFPYEVAGSLIDVLNNIVHTRPLPPSSVLASRQPSAADGRSARTGPPLVNETIEAVVLKALEKEPSARYQSAGELAADIDQYLAGRPTAAVVRRADDWPGESRRQKRRRTIVLASLVLLILITGVLISYRAILTRLGLASLVGKTPAQIRVINHTKATEGETLLGEAMKHYPGMFEGVRQAELVKYNDASELRRNAGGPAPIAGAFSATPLVGHRGAPMWWGIYDKLEAGRYIVVYRVQAMSQITGDNICFLDTCRNGVTIAGRHPTAAEFTPGQWTDMPIALNLGKATTVEYRLWPRGHTIALDRIYVYKLPDRN